MWLWDSQGASHCGFGDVLSEYQVVKRTHQQHSSVSSPLGAFQWRHLCLGLRSGRLSLPSGCPVDFSFSDIQFDMAGWSQALREMNTLEDRTQDHSMLTSWGP